MAVEQLIFTDWPRGQGVDPAASGLQVKACSAGLGVDARKRLAAICMHLGQAYIISNAPQTAVAREQEWLTKTDSRKQVPADVLAAFPVIWSYEQLDQALFALIRTHYTCLTHDGRTGNFLSHALVFTPDALHALAAHPLALQQSSPFVNADADDETVLPSLTEVATAVPPQPTLDILRRSPFHEQLPALVAALVTATPASRPLLICLPEWQQAIPLVESLFYLLPPSRRCRTTFSTYESDRTWIAPAASGRPAGMVTARHLLVLCPPDSRSLNLRADEYNSLFAVFNFAEGRFSELARPGDYATFVARCVEDSRLEPLRRHHDLVESLGLADDLAAWDKLVAAVDVPDRGTDGPWLATAVHNLTALATRPSMAAIALAAIWPHVETLSQNNQAPDIAAAALSLAKLVDVAADPDFITRVQDLVGDVLDAGQVQTAVALLRACGQARERTLLLLLKETLPPTARIKIAPETPADRDAWVELLLEGLRLAEQQPAATPPLPGLLLALFQAAAEADRCADVWGRVGNAVVKLYLDGPWDGEKQTFAKSLALWLSPVACPEGCAWLSMKRVEMTTPQAGELSTLLVQAVGAGARTANATEMVARARQMAVAQFSDKQTLTVTLAQMAEATQGTGSGTTLYNAYQETLESLDPKEQKQVRRKLAKIGAGQILCRELLADVLPWDEAKSPARYQRWHQVALQDSPATLEALYQQTDYLLRQPGQAEVITPLVRRLLPAPAGTAVTPGLSTLYNSLIQILPLAPLSDEWVKSLAVIPDGLPPETTARWRIMKFMRQVTEQASRPDWNWLMFPETDSAWQEDVANLPAPAKEQALAWCVVIVAATGLTTLQEAQKLVVLLAAAGATQPADVAAFVGRLLAGRDPVTAVLVVTAFARCGLEMAKPDQVWGQIVGALLARLDKNTQQLFEAHLKYRFARRDAAYEARLQQLRTAAGLSPAAAESKSAKADPTVAKQPGQETFSPLTTVFGSATRRLRRFISETGGQTPEKGGDDE